MQKPSILLLSAYEAASHALWRQTLVAELDEFEWQIIALEPRHFAWRSRGNSLLWALREREIFERPYAALLATSMVDLAALRGLVPELATTPCLLYFHENQFAFPANRERRSNIEHQLVPMYSALSAQQLAFNSSFNRDSFMTGCRELLQALPDKLATDYLQRLPPSSVLPVPLTTAHTAARPAVGDCLQLLWNHRWEYDKGPELLLAVSAEIRRRGSPLRLHLVGQQFRQRPEQFELIDQQLQRHSEATGIERGVFGFITERERYEQLLASCHCVLSTAKHDFQGLSLQEACLAGCTPLAPRALVYPEYLPSDCLYDLNGSAADTAVQIVDRLEAWARLRDAGEKLPRVDLTDFRTEALIPRYRQMLLELIAGNASA